MIVHKTKCAAMQLLWLFNHRLKLIDRASIASQPAPGLSTLSYWVKELDVADISQFCFERIKFFVDKISRVPFSGHLGQTLTSWCRSR